MPRFRWLNFCFLATLNFSTPTVEDRQLEILIIASIQTLKRGNRKWGKDEVLKLFRDSVDDVTKETFNKALELLIQNQSVKLNIMDIANGNIVAAERKRKPKIEKKWWKLRKISFNGRYWKPQITSLGRIQEYEKFVFDRS